MVGTEEDGVPLGRLYGKVAVVSGGGTGIGAATARLFAKEGATVIITGRRLEPLEKVAADHKLVFAVAGDIADQACIDNVIEMALEVGGRIDIVVANAGTHLSGTTLTVKDADWDRVVDVNLTATMKLVRAALPNMIANRNGSIVLVSSICAFEAVNGAVSYSVSKAGMNALGRSIAKEYGKYGIRANTLCPGWTRTEMADQIVNTVAQKERVTLDEAYKIVTKDLPLQHPAKPEEIATCCLFLASDESSFVTGSELVADGGSTIVGIGGLAFPE